jgi:Fic family protein
MHTYIWQREDWHHQPAPWFTWQQSAIQPQLEALQTSLAELLPIGATLDPDAQMQIRIDTLVQSALRTSEIEGERLDAQSVRSSVVNKLGLQTAGVTDKGTVQTDALVNLLVTATTQLDQPIALATLCEWQAALFVNPSPLLSIKVGRLRGEGPMQVVSGRIDRPTVHFEAPPGSVLEPELTRFLQWFNHPPDELNPYLRAAIAHLWLITLHPFDDGNGRVTRALSDRALAQAENNTIRFYAHSAAIMARRADYYTLLEKTQKGTLEITEWIHWFLETVVDAIALSKTRFEQVIYKTRFWQRHAQTVLNEREIKVLNRLLDSHQEEFTDGINASKYRSLAKVSKATATRELTSLVQKGCLEKLPAGGRSTRYRLVDLN